VAPAARGGLLQPGGWLERNQDLAGGLIRGAGQGLMSGADADADIDYLRERHRLSGSNYAGTDPGARYRDIAPGTSTQTPADRYGSWEYVFDPKQGRIVRAPVS
jgi:hypothetical protein